MKKLILILLTCILFTDANYPAEWYVELYTKGNTTVFVARDQFLELNDLLRGYDHHKYKESFKSVKMQSYADWEYNTKFKNRVKVF